MFKFVVFVFVFSSIRASSEDFAQIGDFPWQVIINLDSAFCGGTLIHPLWVLTSAKCIYSSNVTSIVLGTISLTDDTPEKIINEAVLIKIHENFDHNTLANDIAMIKLKKPIPPNDAALSAPLSAVVITKEKNVTISGWNSIDASVDNLLFINKNIITNDRCTTKYNIEISEDTFCAIGSKKCVTDLGGPLVHHDQFGNRFLSGTTSYLIQTEKGCPTVFTRTSSYITWIQKNFNS